jgi:putative thioredoxin
MQDPGTMNSSIPATTQFGAAKLPPIKDSDTKNFMADVIEASRSVPVLVDFWAPWCGPCKQLTPILEKVVREAGGKVRLVKINVDENQQIAAQMRVQSIPAVFAFVDGQPVDGFMGALPESQIKQFISRLGNKGSLAEEIAAAVKMAEDAVAAGDMDSALAIAGQVLEADPANAQALAMLAKIQIESGDLEGAGRTLSAVPADKAQSPEVVSAKAALELALNPVDTSQLATLSRHLEQNPEDFEKRMEYAIALNGAGERREATEQLLHIFRKQRDWNDDAARKQLVQFFEAWGPKDEATLAGRRRLSSLMFS